MITNGKALCTLSQCAHCRKDIAYNIVEESSGELCVYTLGHMELHDMQATLAVMKIRLREGHKSDDNVVVRQVVFEDQEITHDAAKYDDKEHDERTGKVRFIKYGPKEEPRFSYYTIPVESNVTFEQAARGSEAFRHSVDRSKASISYYDGMLGDSGIPFYIQEHLYADGSQMDIIGVHMHVTTKKARLFEKVWARFKNLFR